MKRLWVILILVFVSCGPSWVPESKTLEVLSSLEKSEFNSRELVILKPVSGLEYLNGYSLESNSSKAKEKYIGMKGNIIGKFTETTSFSRTTKHVIALQNGEYIMASYNPNWSGRNIDGTYFIDEYDSLKKEIVGEYIWLNDKISKSLEPYYISFKNVEMKDEYFSFSRFDKVQIVDVLPKYYFASNPYFLKVKSNNGEIGYLSMIGEGRSFYKSDPISSIQDKKTLELIKNRKVVIGMRKAHILLAIGTPWDISTTESSFGKTEWWSYKNPEKTIMFVNGKVESISNW